MKQQRAAIAVVCSLLGLFGNSGYPVAMELSVECSYPVGEATSTGLIIMSGYDHDGNWQKTWTSHSYFAGFVFFLRQIQGVLIILLLQALTTRITEAPLSTCESEVLNWKGRSPVSRLIRHHVGSTTFSLQQVWETQISKSFQHHSCSYLFLFKSQHLPGWEHHPTNADLFVCVFLERSVDAGAGRTVLSVLLLLRHLLPHALPTGGGWKRGLQKQQQPAILWTASQQGDGRLLIRSTVAGYCSASLGGALEAVSSFFFYYHFKLVYILPWFWVPNLCTWKRQ